MSDEHGEIINGGGNFIYCPRCLANSLVEQGAARKAHRAMLERRKTPGHGTTARQLDKLYRACNAYSMVAPTMRRDFRRDDGDDGSITVGFYFNCYVCGWKPEFQHTTEAAA